MHLAINGYFWNRPNTGSGQYTRQLVYQLNRLVSDLAITLIYPQGEGEGEGGVSLGGSLTPTHSIGSARDHCSGQPQLQQQQQQQVAFVPPVPRWLLQLAPALASPHAAMAASGDLPSCIQLLTSGPGEWLVCTRAAAMQLGKGELPIHCL